MGEKHDDLDAILAAAESSMRAQVATINECEQQDASQDYSGRIFGRFPHWVPPGSAAEFREARNKLLEAGLAEAEIIALMDSCDEFKCLRLDPDGNAIPPERWRTVPSKEVNTLATLRHAWRAGPIEGSRYLIGDSAAKQQEHKEKARERGKSELHTEGTKAKTKKKEDRLARLGASIEAWRTMYPAAESHRRMMTHSQIADEFLREPSYYLRPGEKPYSERILRRKIKEALSKPLKRATRRS